MRSAAGCVAQDAAGAWTRVDDSAQLVASELGIATTPDRLADVATRQAIAKRLATLAVDQIAGAPLDELGRALELTEPLARSIAPEFVTFSGGVAEYIFGRETADHGDIAKLLADEIVAQLKTRLSVPVIEPSERIRATVIGASQFTVQVSGKTIYLPDPGVLPVHNIPVVHLGLDISGDIDVDEIAAAFAKAAGLLDLAPDARIALAFTWAGAPEYPRLAAMARAIMRFAAPHGKTRRAAGADDRRRRRPRARPHHRQGAAVSTASSCRSTACSCASSISSTSASCSTRRVSFRSSSSRCCFRDGESLVLTCLATTPRTTRTARTWDWRSAWTR